MHFKQTNIPTTREKVVISGNDLPAQDEDTPIAVGVFKIIVILLGVKDGA